jgi:hypothetical protein
MGVKLKILQHLLFIKLPPKMAKEIKPLSETSLKYCRMYKDEFLIGVANNLYSNLCNIVVDAS